VPGGALPTLHDATGAIGAIGETRREVEHAASATATTPSGLNDIGLRTLRIPSLRHFAVLATLEFIQIAMRWPD
jgi:hypothetical protein